MIDDKIHGHEWLDFLGSGAAGDGGIAHGGGVDEERDTGEILEDDTGDGEGDFVFTGVLGVVRREVPDVGFGDLASVHVAQDRLENDTDRDWQPMKFGVAELGEGRKGVQAAL